MDFSAEKLENGSATISLRGAINEDSELSLKRVLEELAGIPEVTFDFSETTSINSLGVRAWVQFLRAAAEGRSITFKECTPDIISQINMIPSFAGKANVASFYTFYLCEECNKTEKILIERQNLPPKEMPERAKCPSCGKEMETEELEDEYFAFLLK